MTRGFDAPGANVMTRSLNAPRMSKAPASAERVASHYCHTFYSPTYCVSEDVCRCFQR